jgi:hypothetical protein
MLDRFRWKDRILAKRLVFVPNSADQGLVGEVSVEFTWAAGLALSQIRKSIAMLHLAAKQKGIAPCLEISSKSPDELGVALSAFNLKLERSGKRPMSVECAYQGSKVFERGGPYTDLYDRPSRDAKTDDRLHNSGAIIGFRFLGEDFPALPVTAFYDWLYLSALDENRSLADGLHGYAGFTDIVFNPVKSLNCQARAAALYVAANKAGHMPNILKDRNAYLELMEGLPTTSLSTPVSSTLVL